MEHSQTCGPERPETLRDYDEDPWIGSLAPEIGRPFTTIVVDRKKIAAQCGELSPYRPPEAPRSGKPREAAIEKRPPRVRRGEDELKPLSIINQDDRRVYDDWRYPWGLVCRIESRPGRFGSGVLIGPRHVLTASHVIDWDRKVANIEVHAFDGDARAHASVVKVFFWTKIDQVDYSTVDEDYAVCVIDQRLGDHFGWMGSKQYDSSWDEDEYWQSIGYAEDLGSTRRPQWQPNFYLDEDEADFGSGRAMTSNGDFVHGQSGSPVFGRWGGDPYVVAVVSAERGDDNWCSGGSDLPDLVNFARTQDP